MIKEEAKILPQSKETETLSGRTSLMLEKKHRLKYFYFIDPDNAIQQIRNTKEYKEFTPDSARSITNLFHMIFSKIIDLSKPYSEYILSNHNASYKSIFGEDPYNQNVLKLHTLSGITLFHHCITKSFFHFISTDAKYTSDIKLSSTEKGTVAKGFLNPFSSHDNPELKNEKAASRDNDRNKHLFNQKADFYSTKYLQAYLKQTKGDKRTTYFVPKYASLFCYFLWLETSNSPFSKSLQKDTEIARSQINKYQAVESAFLKWHTALSNEDKLVFSIFMESAYGFFIFPYLGELLDTITCTKPSDTNTLKDLEGQGFVNLLKGVLDLPITYNRSILLKYAYTAVLASKELEPQFPSKSGNAIAFTSVTPKSKVMFSSKALELLDAYFHMLNQVTLPLIEDLWDVLTYKEFLGKEICLNSYRSFIAEHYNFMTLDYSTIDLSKLLQDDYCKRHNFSYYYKHWERNLSNPPAPTRNITSILGSTKKSLQYLLNYYCSNNRIHLANEQIINSILYPDPDGNNMMTHRQPLDNERNLFFDTHINSIYDFAKILPNNQPHKKNLDLKQLFND